MLGHAALIAPVSTHSERDGTPVHRKHVSGANKSGGPRAAAQEPFGSKPLDHIDLSRQVARDLKANFLLANGRLRPDFHGGSSREIILRTNL